MIPYGECHCGCGERTKLAPRTRPDAGWIEGEPLRYLFGHKNALKVRWVAEDRGYETPCWIWQGTKITKGYGRTNTKGRQTFAHIIEWEKVNGLTPDGLELDHLCRVPACCNPDHLEAVTHAENMRRSERCVITPDLVTQVRRLLPSGMTQQAIADCLGIKRHNVSQIKNGRAWVGVG